MSQHVKTPTHKKGHILDLVITKNCADTVSDISVSNHQITDHSSVVAHLLVGQPPQKIRKLVSSRNIKRIPLAQFSSDIAEQLAGLVSVRDGSDVNRYAEQYLETVSRTLEQHAPTTTKLRAQAVNARWMTAEIKAARILRRSNEAKWRRTGLEVHRQIFKEHRDDVHKLIISAKKAYYQHKISHASSRETFAILADLTEPNNTTLPAEPSVDLANRLASFFDNKVQVIRENIMFRSSSMPSFMESDHEPVPADDSFPDLRPLDIVELRHLFRESNNKSCGLDPCPTNLLKDSLDAHLPAVLHLFNASLNHGVFPEAFKRADVTPILKKPGLDEQLLSNYRPVSNLQFLSKLLERVVVDRLLSHIEQLNLHEKFQSAYQSHHSTETALLRVQDDISGALDRNRGVMLAMIDLSAAFDTVDHSKFITLLEDKYAVKGGALDWFRSYLSGRQFSVKVDSFRSDQYPLNCGVPQGSVLGPVIFNMYTTPLERIVQRHKLHYHKYADDMQIYGEFDPKSDSDRQRIKHQLEHCLADIRAWMLKNMLKINDNKTELIVFMNPQQAKVVVQQSDSSVPAILLGDSTIEATNTVRNLGVVMNIHLDAGDQISAVVKSCNYHLRKIAQVRHYISDEACKLAVLTLVMSRLDYCNGLLSGATALQLNKLQRIQNRAARLVVRPCVVRGQVLHMTPILQQLHWLPVRQRVAYKLCLQVYKCLHDTGPSYLKELLHLYTRDQRLRQASHHQLVPRHPRRSVGRAGFSVSAPTSWNMLPSDLRQADTVAGFQRNLKTFLWHMAYS